MVAAAGIQHSHQPPSQDRAGFVGMSAQCPHALVTLAQQGLRWSPGSHPLLVENAWEGRSGGGGEGGLPPRGRELSKRPRNPAGGVPAAAPEALGRSRRKQHPGFGAEGLGLTLP